MKETYKFHEFNEEQQEKMAKIREAYSSLDSLVTELTKPSREQSLATTNLEQSMMWAIKGLFVNKGE